MRKVFLLSLLLVVLSLVIPWLVVTLGPAQEPAVQPIPSVTASAAVAPDSETAITALSGGERLKAALACVLWRREPAQLLLLDEPTNHLDLASTQAIESALAAFPGAMLVVSHDEAFLQGLKLTHSLAWRETSWHFSLL